MAQEDALTTTVESLTYDSAPINHRDQTRKRVLFVEETWVLHRHVKKINKREKRLGTPNGLHDRPDDK